MILPKRGSNMIHLIPMIIFLEEKEEQNTTLHIPIKYKHNTTYNTALKSELSIGKLVNEEAFQEPKSRVCQVPKGKVLDMVS